MARLSVVIPTNRPHQWLPLSIRSVLEQLSQDDELVLVLDGTAVEPDQNWLNDARIKIVRNQRSQGVGHALRLGLEASSGEFIARLDSDDVALPNRFERQIAYLKSRPNVLAVASNVQMINSEGSVTGVSRYPTKNDVRKSLLFQNVIVQSAVVFRRAAYDHVGGYPKYQQMEDYILWLRLGTIGQIAIIPELLTQYRLHPGQLSRGAKPFAEYTSTVIEARNQLALVLGVKNPKQLLYNAIWISAQVSRYYASPLSAPLKKLFLR